MRSVFLVWWESENFYSNTICNDVTLFNARRWDCVWWDLRIPNLRYAIAHWTGWNCNPDNGMKFRFQTVWNWCLTLYRFGSLREAREIPSKYITRGQLCHAYDSWIRIIIRGTYPSPHTDRGNEHTNKIMLEGMDVYIDARKKITCVIPTLSLMTAIIHRHVTGMIRGIACCSCLVDIRKICTKWYACRYMRIRRIKLSFLRTTSSSSR